MKTALETRLHDLLCQEAYGTLYREAVAALKEREKTIERLQKFVSESGTTLNACECGRGKKPKFDLCEVCERDKTIRELRSALERND